jgi:Bacteriophage Sf6, terminase small subunit-like
MQADLMADEIIEIADDARNDWVMRDGQRVLDRENINWARLRIDARKWLMARLAPKKWGNRLGMRS